MGLSFFAVLALAGADGFFNAVGDHDTVTRRKEDGFAGGGVAMEPNRRAGNEGSAQDLISFILKDVGLQLLFTAVEVCKMLKRKFVKIDSHDSLLCKFIFENKMKKWHKVAHCVMVWHIGLWYPMGKERIGG
jgi:hypothetical protein